MVGGDAQEVDPHLPGPPAETSRDQPSIGPAFHPGHRAVLGAVSGADRSARVVRTSAKVVQSTYGTPSARQMAGRCFFAKTTSAYSAPYRSVWPSPTKA